MNRRLLTLGFVALLSVAASNLPAPGASAADAPWPSRPIHLVVPYPPGGPLDAVARLTAQKVSADLGEPIVVDNKAGAGGNIGADAVAKAAPDGYTLLLGAVATHAINPSLYASMPFDSQRDFEPVTQLASTPNVLIVNPALPVKSVAEFIAYAKAHPGALNFGSGSTGSAGHLAGELFKRMAGIEMTHVPYKGAAPAMQDLIAGQVNLMFDNLASALTQIKAGKVRALAVTTAKRTPLAPDLPTIAESGLPGFDINTWFGVFVPAKTPRAIVQRLHDEFAKALAQPDVREKMLGLGAEPVASTPEQFGAYVRSEAAKYAKIVKASGARVD
jgi:tripartite-type tricarboxylate transporter receptor subunit TctC